MKKKSKSNTSPTKASSGIGLGVWVGIAVLVVSICAILYFPTETKISKSSSETAMNSPSKVQSSTKPVVSNESKTKNEVMSYEEYIVVSKKNGWLPVDPVEKLEATIVKFGQLMDVVDPKDVQLFSQYLAMLNTEVTRMITILSHSTHRNINLTTAVYRALDVIHEVTYRIMKLALSTGNAKMITRSSVNGNLQHWMYAPLRELLKVISSHPQHITADINAASNTTTGQVSVLEKIATHKWYGLISVAMDIGADATSIIQALRISIVQADDMAVAGILHHLSRTKQSITMQIVEAFPSLMELASQLHLSHIQQRLQATVTRDSPIVALFNEYSPYSQHPVQCLTSVHSTVAPKVNAAGYVDPILAYVYKESESVSLSDTAVESVSSEEPATTTTTDTTTDTDTTVTGSLSVCQVDRRDVTSLTVEEFYTQYVALNRAVLLTSPTFPTMQQEVGEGEGVASEQQYTRTNFKASQPVHDHIWELDTLLAELGETMEVASAIPYATLFGHTEEVISLQDFVHHPEKGMRAYSDRFTAALDSLCDQYSGSIQHSAVSEKDRRLCWMESEGKGLTGQAQRRVTGEGRGLDMEGQGKGLALSEVQVALLRRLVGLPRYIFSGVQQNMNKAMRKHMLQAILAFDKNNNSTTNSTSSTSKHPTGTLLEYMYTVSTFPLLQPTTTLHRDFKSHWKSQFFLGPVLSGAPFHHHGPAFNLLMYGRKQWTLLPPGRDIYSSVHPVDWIAEGGVSASYYPYKDDNHQKQSSVAAAAMNTDRPCELIQQAGEVLYVPRHWTHQILNLAESIGFAVEIDDYKV